ncbi:hypothetical protein [Sporosarcina sp. FSL K6-2383]|uniref:hypothetical protein n=1 Tax=Sporosarcina sp. FSL K6-2383 TaxID=2921556 RepID=UPI00315A0769
MKQTIFGIVLYILLWVPPVISLVESIMILHMLVQIPLLMIVGWLVGQTVLKKYYSFFMKWNGNGIPGILFIVFITMYWMLPRAMDEALAIWYIELFKFIGLPLAGLALRDSWDKLQVLGKSFIFLNYISMFGLMGWLYVDSPIQLCNNYLELEQKILGWGFLFITAGMIIYIVQLTFMDHSEEVI